MSKIKERLKEKIKSLPNKPGIYQYYDAEDKIIYIGKAKNLKNRVSSYFSKEKFENYKTKVLVSRIHEIKFIIVSTEYEALLLENSLIKQYQPRFNIQLRDDKTYPWLCLKKEQFPRIFPTRTMIDDGSEYYGPYASVRMMKTLFELVKHLYKPRTCTLNLSQKNIEANKFKVCLEYHIGNCKAPCVGKQSEDDYNANIDEIRNIVRGNIGEVIRLIKSKMDEASALWDYEKAAVLKQKLDLLEKYQAKSTVVNPKIHNIDVFSFLEDDKFAYINFLKMFNGAVIQSHTIEIKKALAETREELLEQAIIELRSRFKSQSREVFTPFPVNIEFPEVRFIIPQRGDKKKLMEMSLRNASYFMKERQKEQEKVDPDRFSNRVLKKLQEDLRLKELPTHIECFDNSNIQGAFPVAACVVFKNAKPSKADYRHFNIKTVEGPNDFASMEEVVFRRYQRMLNESENLPQLIVIDGGKGQLSSAVKSLEKLELRGKISIIGIAKRLEEIYFPEDSFPLHIDKRSESLKLIQQLRNEAHRFGITFHRKKREKGTIKSSLDSLEGFGGKSIEKLLKHFKSIKRIYEANDDDLLQFINRKQLQTLRNAQRKTFTET